MAEVVEVMKDDVVDKTSEHIEQDMDSHDEPVIKRRRGRPPKTKNGTSLMAATESVTTTSCRPRRNVIPRVSNDYVYSSPARSTSPAKDDVKSQTTTTTTVANKKTEPNASASKRKLKLDDVPTAVVEQDETGEVVTEQEVVYQIEVQDFQDMVNNQDTIVQIVEAGEDGNVVIVGNDGATVATDDTECIKQESNKQEDTTGDATGSGEGTLSTETVGEDGQEIGAEVGSGEDEDKEIGSFPQGYQPTEDQRQMKKVYMKNPNDPLRRFACPYAGCSYVAKYRSNLWDHKKTHTGEKPYHCTWPDCTMRFSQTHQLKLHLRSHTGERPYKCTWPGCDAAFSQKPGLRSHSLTHTGEKDFKCDFPGCNWTFRLKGALTDHKRAIHENAKKYMCEWPGCGKRFLQSCHLKKHLMAHADIKPFACDWPKCTYKAVTMAYVTNHRRTHTGERNHECPYEGCHKRFVKSSHLNRHRQRCHAGAYHLNTEGEFIDNENGVFDGEENQQEFFEEGQIGEIIGEEVEEQNPFVIEYNEQEHEWFIVMNGVRKSIKGEIIEDKDGRQYLVTSNDETGESEMIAVDEINPCNIMDADLKPDVVETQEELYQEVDNV